METKTAKILSVQENQRSYNSKNGQAFVHMITFEGDQHQKVWEYHSTKQNCEKFKVGETTTFDIDIQVNGQYTNYKIKPKQQDTFKKGEPKDQGIITYLSCLSSAANYFSQKGTSDWNEVMNAAANATNEAIKFSTLKS